MVEQGDKNDHVCRKDYQVEYQGLSVGSDYYPSSLLSRIFCCIDKEIYSEFVSTVLAFYHHTHSLISFCQAHFKFSPSSVQYELRLAL